MIKKIKQTIIAGFLVAFATIGLVSVPAYADCGGVKTSIIDCTGADKGGSGTKSGIWAVLMLVLNIMTAGVGILGVGGVVYGSIMYASAGDKADQTKKAIGIITNVVIGLLAYGFMYLVLNFLIPGGIFNTAA